MPHPKQGELKKDFIKRCIPQLIHEGKQPNQSAAICYSIYQNTKKINRTLLYHHF